MNKYSSEIENISAIKRKMTVRVPAELVQRRFNQELAEIQKTANVKGFRIGSVPLSILKQHYGEDARHRIFHKLIDEVFSQATLEHQLKVVGDPKIDTPDHKTGDGQHDHTLHEDQNFVFIAEFEVFPEIQLKAYSNLPLNREVVKVDDELLKQAMQDLLDSQAELISARSGLTSADGKASSRPAQKGDFLDFRFEGGLVTEAGVQLRNDMKGQDVLEIGSNSFIPGFEDHLLGLRAEEEKTFRLHFPEDYGFAELAGKEAEFKVFVHDVKEKKLPELNDEFAKGFGCDGLEQLRQRTHQTLEREKTRVSERRLQSDLLAALIEKNPFEVPRALIGSQTKLLVEEWVRELKKQKLDDQTIEQMIKRELPTLSKRAETQVQASLILETIAEEEKITASLDEINLEMERMAQSLNFEKAKMLDFYEKNPARREDLEFRVKQEKVIQFLLSKSKIKNLEASSASASA